MSVDYYEVLGVTPSASSEDIKKAYKKRALEYHPDRQSGSDELFKKLGEAYSVLNNPDSRENYDRRRKVLSSNPEGFTSKFAKVASAATTTAKKVVNDFVDESLFETLDKILGRKREPNNLEVTLKVTLEEIYDGAEKRIAFKRRENCDTCKGRGATAIEDIKVCSDCYGLGHTMSNLASLFTKEECKKCKGTGRIILKKCGECDGRGEYKYERECTFKIPKDLNLGNDKDRLLLEGEGEYGGNVLVQIEVKPHRFYEIVWPNLHIDLPVQFYQAALGDYIEIDTLRGSAVFNLPTGTESGDTITLKGYGLRLPDLDDIHYGDLLITVHIEVPKRMNKEQKELLQKYKELDPNRKKIKPRAK